MATMLRLSISRIASLNSRSLFTGPAQSGLQSILAMKVVQNQRTALQSSTNLKCIRGIRGLATETSHPASLAEVLDREIQDETAELNKQLSSDQFPGFSVETDGADVALTKQVGDKTVNVRFTVSSSLNEWPAEQDPKSNHSQNQDMEMELNTTLLSMPEFQVQITRDNQTLELSCYFEDMEEDPETGEAYACDPVFGIDEMVMYEGEPSETEFAVNARYFDENLTNALMQYLAENGIDDEFAKNLVAFSTRYEKKHYVGLMKRLKNFVSK